MTRNLLLTLLLVSIVFAFGPAQAQKNKPKTNTTTATSQSLPRPKLVVGIVVDQMRYDFLYRYWDKYTEGGFKRLVQQGYNCRNTHYNYTPTYTGPGHASIYTGTTPSVHGIVGNDWFICETSTATYCTQDPGVTAIGNQSVAGQMSPRQMLPTTITDELRLATNRQSKVIGVCLKDRGSILPAGHMANAAYWYDGSDGNFISSSYYLKELPQWVTDFNNRKLADKYLSQTWTTLLPIEQYTESTPDDVPWETGFDKGRPVFPYELQKLRGSNFNLLRNTPWGNTITIDMAIAALEGEKMGQGSATDFLAMSFSSPDYIGHQFGPNSVEIQDNYLRLDRDIADFLTYLDKQYGQDNVLLFLTADHGAAHVPAYLQSVKVPAGTLPVSQHGDSIRAFMNRRFGKEKWVLEYTNQQVYLDRNLIVRKKLDLRQVQQQVAQYAANLRGVARAISAVDLSTTDQPAGWLRMLQNGHYPKRSGDVYLLLEPGWFEAYSTQMLNHGTTHGSPASYDTHVPLIWYGWRVQPGQTVQPVSITDIAPTLADLLHIMEPSGCTGNPLALPLR